MRGILFACGSFAWILAIGKPGALASVFPPEPQMRLPYYFEEEATDRLRLMDVLLHPDPPPTDLSVRTRFVVVRKSATEVRPSLEWKCVAAVFDPMASVPRASFSLADPLPPVQWLTGSFRIERGDVWTRLRFAGEPSGFETHTINLWKLLNEDATYRVAVRFSNWSEPGIEQILLGGEVIYDQSICGRHNAKMTRVDVTVRWGNPTDWNLWPSAGKTRPPNEALAEFPNYVERLNGGCLPPPDLPATLLIYQCSRCRDAFTAWRRTLGR